MCNGNLTAINSQKVYFDTESAALLKIASQTQGIEIFSLTVLLGIIGRRIYVKYFNGGKKSEKKTLNHSRGSLV